MKKSNFLKRLAIVSFNLVILTVLGLNYTACGSGESKPVPHEETKKIDLGNGNFTWPDETIWYYDSQEKISKGMICKVTTDQGKLSEGKLQVYGCIPYDGTTTFRVENVNWGVTYDEPRFVPVKRVLTHFSQTILSDNDVDMTVINGSEVKPPVKKWDHCDGIFGNYYYSCTINGIFSSNDQEAAIYEIYCRDYEGENGSSLCNVYEGTLTTQELLPLLK